ncbi:MAG TPA: hypothetical protein VLM17_06955 [Xanthomonadaceae bacterium]|nr:hypothetical protein [Xanthomonadaceae bacterium]
MPRLRLLASALALTLALPLAHAAGADGRSIDKVNGSITASAGQAWGALTTVNGSIHVEDGVTTGNAETVNGSIKVGDSARTGSLQTVNGSIRLGRDVQAGDLTTVNGSVFADHGDRLARDIETVNGSIGLVHTELAGGIRTVTGDITVGVSSHVHGGIHVEKQQHGWNLNLVRQRPPRIVVGPNATVDGPLVFEREVVLYVHDSAKTGPVTGAKVLHFSGDHAPME